MRYISCILFPISSRLPSDRMLETASKTGASQHLDRSLLAVNRQWLSTAPIFYNAWSRFRPRSRSIAPCEDSWGSGLYRCVTSQFAYKHTALHVRRPRLSVKSESELGYLGTIPAASALAIAGSNRSLSVFLMFTLYFAPTTIHSIRPR